MGLQLHHPSCSPGDNGMKLVLATHNKNKIREIHEKFSHIENLELLTLDQFQSPPEVDEDGSTFEENAEKKARTIAEFAGLPAMSDDSGLCVDALDGRPGVLSARYGGDNTTDKDRYMKLLHEMESREDDRNAQFVCAIAIAIPHGKCYTTRGICRGIIAKEPSGDQGFGYDPVFFLPQYDKTMAEIPLSEKNKISHRARALEKAAEILVNLIEKQ